MSIVLSLTGTNHETQSTFTGILNKIGPRKTWHLMGKRKKYSSFLLLTNY